MYVEVVLFPWLILTTFANPKNRRKQGVTGYLQNVDLKVNIDIFQRNQSN